MEHLLELFLSGGIRIPYLNSDLIRLDQELPKSDLLALLMLQKRGEAAMSELAADLGVPLSTATGIGSRLEKRGLVRRERSPKDKRIIVLQLTPEGLDLAARARAQVDSLIGRMQAALTPEELQQLIGLVQKVLAAMAAPASGGTAGDTSRQPRQIPIEE